MKDQSILNSANKKGESYLEDLAFDVCINGKLLEKDKKIVEKQYGNEAYANMQQFAHVLQQQVERGHFTNTSLLNLKYLGKNAGMSEKAIDMIIKHFKSKIYEEQQQREDNEYWNNCDHNDKHALLEYAKKYPQGQYIKEAFAKIIAINIEEKVKREEKAYWDQCNPNDKCHLNEYLKKYPTGVYVARAKSLIADLERIEKKAVEESRVFNQCHTQQDYINYLSKYPNGTYSTKAKAIIEEFGRKEIEENRDYNLCKDKSDYLGYLRKYPNGKYVKDAQDKIKALENAANSIAKETAFWNQCSPNSIPQLQEYLRKYPKGMYATRAKLLIADLERIEKKAVEESRVFNQCHTQQDYINYLSKYPNGTYSTKAKAIIEEFGRKEIEENRDYNLCKDKSDYLGYLRKYPNGKYVKDAQDKIKALENAANSIAKETAFWNQCSPNSIPQLQEYLRKYPKGMYATRARSLIANVERIEKEAIEESRAYNQCSTRIDYMDYLRNYPNGLHKVQAQVKIEEFDRVAAQERAAYVREKNIFEQCKTKDDYLQYISLYPKGKYVSQARNKIENIEKKTKEFFDSLGKNNVSSRSVVTKDDEVPKEIRSKLTKLNKTAGRSYILAALAFAFLPNVFRWNHWAHIELEFDGNAPTLWLFWLPIVASLWGYFCHWLDSEVYTSIRSTRSAMKGDWYLTIIPCLVLLLWMAIDGFSLGYFMEDILKVFVGPIVCGIAWCYGLYCECKMSRIAKNLLPDDN